MPTEEDVRQMSPQEADEALGYGPDEQETTPEEDTVEEWDGTPEDDEPEVDSTETALQQESPPQKIFGKYDSIEQAEEGFRNLSATLGRQSQELGQLRQYVQLLQGILQGNVQQQQQQVAQQSQQTQPQIDPAKLWEQLAENPQETIVQLVSPLVEQRIAQERALLGQAMQNMMAPVQPVLQQWQHQQMAVQVENAFRQQVQEVSQRYPDFPEYVEEMRKRIQANPQILAIPGAFEIVYKAVKQDAAANQARAGRSRATKAAARLPRTGARTIQQRGGNDALVEDALGPLETRGEWS